MAIQQGPPVQAPASWGKFTVPADVPVEAKAIAAAQKNKLMAPPTVSADELELVRTTIAQGATDAELKLYLYDCARQGVHPLDRLLHFTKRSGKYVPVTSIDFMRQRAAETGEYAGSDDAVMGETEGLPEHPTTATVTVWRLVQGQRCAFTATARWAEYKPDQDFMWRKMPFTMLAKCAEALALRKGFPRQLAGLYAAEEMDQAENTQKAPQKPQDAPRAAIAAQPPPQPVPAGVDATTGEDFGSEEFPPCPDGAFLVAKYGKDRFGWHTGLLFNGRDIPFDRAIGVKTKYETGDVLKAAAETKRPIVAKWNEKSYLTAADWWIGPVAKALSSAMTEDPPLPSDDDIPF